MKKILIASTALLAGISMTARHLTPDQALERLSNNKSMHAPALKAASRSLVYSAQADELERLYVFESKADKSFVVLSADDTVEPLLAYSDGNDIDFDNLPDNLRYWLDEYARQIAYAAKVGNGPARVFVQRPSVEPKITTLWDQLEPFNSMTPEHQGFPTPTGCVATAMSQIMNWHKWPVKPTGQKSFQSHWIGNLSIDYDKITFEWDKMLDRYYKTSPQENINAVATLMMATGYAAEMEYHRSSSGAAGYKAAIGLFTHFGYNKSMSLENREWYDGTEWDNLVYAELTENGPVYYQGTGNGGGHAFVCDGYDSETGLFHFNWGWTGSGNGYYRLSALNPDVQGTGGNSLGYNYTQDIIRGLRKADPTADEQPVLTVTPGKGVVTPFETAQLGSPITLKGYETTDGFKNSSLVTIKDFEFGARIHNEATGQDIDVCSTNGKIDFEPYYKINIIRFTLPVSLPEGEYTITPIWRSGEQGKWNEMRFSPQTRNYVPMLVEGTTATFGFGIAEGVIDVTLTEMPDFFTTNGEFTLKGSMSSVGTKDFTGLLCAVFVGLDKNGELQVIDQGAAERVDLEPGKTIEFEYTSRPVNGKLVDGDQFGIVIGNANTGELVSPIYKIKVGNRYGNLEMSTYNYSIASSSFLDPENVNVTATVKVVSGEYEGPLAIGFAKKREPFAAERFTISEPMFFTAGDEKEITFKGTLDDVNAGTLYYAHLMRHDADGNWITVSQYPITVVVAKSYSGIENVDVENAAQPAYYDIYGLKVDNPTPGNVYIRVDTRGKASKTIF